MILGDLRGVSEPILQSLIAQPTAFNNITRFANRVSGFGSGGVGFGSRVSGLGFRGLGFRVSGLGFLSGS